MIAVTIFILCELVTSKAYEKNTIQCDYYEGYPITKHKADYYKNLGVEDTCTLKIKPCSLSEDYRRLDGSCNNLNRECRGTYFEPMPRMLPASFYNGYHSRKAISGKDLKLPRFIRTHLIKEGYSVHKELTTSVTNYAIFTVLDIGSTHDIIEFLQNRTYTCDPAYKYDYWSTPNLVPEDDPVHRFSGIRCLNLTRPLFYQNYKCTQDFVPSPIAKATSAFDLSQVYNYYNTGAEKIRAFFDGLLLTEKENGRNWPPNGKRGYCPTNKGNEKRCLGYQLNGLPGDTLLTIIYYRNHNYFARKLKEVNPSWNDEKLFHTARDMNIAVYLQIYLYELLSTLMGRENLIEAGVLCENDGHRDVYDDTLYPTITLEYSFIQRWYHKLQQGILKQYDKRGAVYKEIKIPELLFRTGYIPVDNNIEGMVLSMLMQPSSDPDSVDYEIAEYGLGFVQKSTDIVTSDIHKSRLLGFPPYVDYLQYCFGANVTEFAELQTFISKENIELLKDCYDDVRDIDLMAGVTSENYVEGGFVPYTFACIVKEFLHKYVRSDRFFYERYKRPNRFSADQLKEIRKSTLSMLLCNVGKIKQIQPNAFRIIGPGNEMVPCENIPNINFSAWDSSNA